MDEAFDKEEDVEPRLMRFMGEEGIAGGGDVKGAEREEEVEWGGGGLVEGLGVEGDEIES